jgi:hypothetical protein
MQYVFLILAIVLFGYSDVDKHCIYGGFIFLAFALLLVVIDVEQPTNKSKRRKGSQQPAKS